MSEKTNQKPGRPERTPEIEPPAPPQIEPSHPDAPEIYPAPQQPDREISPIIPPDRPIRPMEPEIEPPEKND